MAISNQLNATYPRLFKDEIEQDTDLNPGANPNPPHDPKIYPASVLCLLAGATLLIFCIWKVMSRHYFDEFYTRGFLASAGAVLSLLLLILSVVMYQEAVKQLNLAFPNLVATQGPCITLIGIAFMCFSLASFVLLRGCMSIDEASTSNNEGYSAI